MTDFGKPYRESLLRPPSPPRIDVRAFLWGMAVALAIIGLLCFYLAHGGGQ